jgi:hypothetical protein
MVLVPFTILGHEAMASYGDSWYVKWISYSLILGTLPFHLPLRVADDDALTLEVVL